MAVNTVLAKMAVKIAADTAEFKGALAKTQTDLKDFQSSLTKIATGIGLAFGVREVANFAFEVSKLAGEAEGVRGAFEKLPGSIQLMLDLKKATNDTVSELDLMKRSVQAANFGISLQALPKLLEFASIRAQQTGQSVDYLVDSIVTGIGRKSPLILDNLGISAVALKDKLNGVSVAAADVGQVAEAVGAIASESLKEMGEFSDNAQTKVEKLSASWVNFQVAVGNAANGTGLLGAAIDSLSGSLDVLASKNLSFFEKFQGLLGGAFSLGAAKVEDYVREVEKANAEQKKQEQIIREVDHAFVEFNGNIEAYGKVITQHIYKTELLAEFQRRLVKEEEKHIETLGSLKDKLSELNAQFAATDINDTKKLANIGREIVAINEQIAALEELRKKQEQLQTQFAKDQLKNARAGIETSVKERGRKIDEMQAIITAAENEEKRSLKAEERTKWSNLKKEIENMDEEISILEEQEKFNQRSARPVIKIENQNSLPSQSNDAPVSLRSQIGKWIEANKETITAIRNGEKRDLPPLELRAVATMTHAKLNAGESPFLPNSGAVQGSIIDLNRAQPTFWNRLTKGRTGLSPYVWVNKVNKEGSAQFIGEGELKPLASFELEAEQSVPKKVAERMKASTEVLYDIEGLASLIENELRFEVETAANTAVLTGTASATSPAGVTTLASAFTLTTIETPTPNNADAIRAAIAQLRSLRFTNDIVAFVNPIDGANMDLTKGEDGHYVLPPFTTADGQTVKGVKVIEDDNIAVGNLLVGDMSKYRVLMYQDFFVRWGWENDDFSKNLVTVIGEMRFHQFMSGNHEGAFIYDSFADIKTAIAAA